MFYSLDQDGYLFQDTEGNLIPRDKYEELEEKVKTLEKEKTDLTELLAKCIDEVSK